jgi:hypothetical protein
MSFANLEQRMVSTYLDTFPSFVPSENGPPIAAQKQFYQFIHGTYRRLYEQPELLVRELHDDDAHTNRFNKGQDNKPKLKDDMRKVLKEVDRLLGTMFWLGQSGRAEAGALVVDGDVKVGKKHRLLLAELGVKQVTEPGRTVLSHADDSDLFSAWTWMASRPGASLLTFSRCMFAEEYPYASHIYARLSGSENAFRRLERYLMDHAYMRIDNRDGAVTLDYVKGHGDKEPPKPGFQYGVRHTGISVSYDALVKESFTFGLCVPRMKEIVTAFDAMEARVQDFVVATTKQCDGCRYCVQTDKTGKRPLAKMPVSHGGRTYNLCPYFPGYRYCWTSLSEGLVDNMIALLDFMDRLFDGEKAQGGFDGGRDAGH